MLKLTSGAIAHRGSKFAPPVTVCALFVKGNVVPVELADPTVTVTNL